MGLSATVAKPETLARWLVPQPGQARIITDGNAPFNQMTWRALLRKLDRDAPDYKT